MKRWSGAGWSNHTAPCCSNTSRRDSRASGATIEAQVPNGFCSLRPSALPELDDAALLCVFDLETKSSGASGTPIIIERAAPLPN
jgi:hypothetical protein